MAACRQAEPQILTVVQTVVVQQEREPVVVVETVEVTRQIEKVVTIEVTPAAALPREGQVATLAVFDGPQLAGLERRARTFETVTGATVRLEAIEPVVLLDFLLNDLASGANRFDGFVINTQWLADFVEPGYLLDLTERVEADAALAWTDIAPFFREIGARYRGPIYAIPLDSSLLIIYYRTDVLEEIGMAPPQTWDQYVEIAAVANGLDMNVDGEPDYGSCLGLAPGGVAEQLFLAMAAPVLQVQGSRQGAFFDLDTFEPLVDNPGFKRALEIYQESFKYGPPDPHELGLGETRQLMLAGRCALTVDGGDLGKLAIAPKPSLHRNELAAAMLPGSAEVLDRQTGQLVKCEEKQGNCPYAVDEVNYAPLAAWGGWAGAINAAAAESGQTVAYEFLAYLSAPAQANIDVTQPAGFNPFRMSQYLNRQPWVEAGLSPIAARDYLRAVEDTLTTANSVLDLRVPGRDRYQAGLLAATLKRYLAAELTTDEAAATLKAQWEALTAELGREQQLDVYRASLSLE
jgi:multiple sugar transport system substrate-binding protein